MNYAVILSGGTGSRLGLDIPKQYYKVADKPIIRYVIETITQCDFIDKYVIVAAVSWQPFIFQEVHGIKAQSNAGSDKFLGFAVPGDNRQLSIYNGLLALKEVAGEEDIILIQDAARPNTTADLLRRCVSFSGEEDGAMPVLPMKDTIYLSNTGKSVNALLKRQELFAGQAPEAFRFGKYLRANEALLPDRILEVNGSTEPAILTGMNIAMIHGDENNYKITTAEDLARFCRQITEGGCGIS